MRVFRGVDRLRATTLAHDPPPHHLPTTSPPPPHHLPTTHSPTELARGDTVTWTVTPPASVAPAPGARPRRGVSATGFAAVLPPSATNADAAAAAGVVDAGAALLTGRNVACLVYGATGSGKTHTMLGRGGLASVAAASLFDAVASAGLASIATITLSFIELYNERPRDLLAGWSTAPLPRRSLAPAPTLPVRPCSTAGAIVAGATRVRLTSATEAAAAITAGATARAAAPTPRNAASSRSHALLTLALEVPASESRGRGMHATLTLADLAGSESGATAPRGRERRAEGAAVNKSLLALGAVVDALGAAAEDAAARRPPRPRHVPWRDSKLTRLLEGALSRSGARVALVATLAPGDADAGESASTLSFAARAARVPVVSHVVSAREGVAPARGGGERASPAALSDTQLALDATRAEVDALHAAVATVARLEARVAALEASVERSSPAQPRSPRAAAVLSTPRRSPLRWWRKEGAPADDAAASSCWPASPPPTQRRHEPASPLTPPPPPRPPPINVPAASQLARLSPASLDALATDLAAAAERVRVEAARRARRQA